MTIEEIERLSMTYAEIPKELSQPEQILFLGLRVLHYEYRQKMITFDRAKKEKAILVQKFNREMQMHQIYKRHLHIRNRLSHKLTKAIKQGCPMCKELVCIFDEKGLKTQEFRGDKNQAYS